MTKLGCKLARRYDDRITLDFFGDQVVCHLTPGEPAAPESLYPRHFGVTFREAADFEALHACAVTRKIPFYHEVSLRFEGLVEEHRTFVLVDPTGNLLEFKHYNDRSDDVLNGIGKGFGHTRLDRRGGRPPRR